MRELNAGSHKVRRSSFSNTLSLLPEVEEPYSEVNTPIPAIVEEIKPKARTDFNHVPASIHVVSLPPKSRPRIQTLPSMSKSKLYNKDPTYRRRFSSDSATTGGKHLTFLHDLRSHAGKIQSYTKQPYWKRSEHHAHDDSRRWSIDSVVSHGNQDSLLPHRRPKKDDVDNAASNDTGIYQQNETTTVTPRSENEKKVSNISLKPPLNSPRKYSDPNIVLEDKDRLDILRGPLLNRRWSNPAFAETTKKVNMVLRLGRNMRNKLNPTDTKTDRNKTIRTLADLAVEMPKNPRFSALMSPEAQYSIMMGYEDKIYDGLVKQCPEYENVLKRNKTPVQKIHIRRKSSLGFLDGDDNDDYKSDDDSDVDSSERQASTVGNSFLTQSTEDTGPSFSTSSLFGSRYHQHRGSTQSFDSSVSELPERSDSRNTLRNLRRLSLSMEKKDYLNRLFDKIQQEDDDDNIVLDTSYLNLSRSCSLPNVSCLPFNRRLVMTHRLESAMDILDAMKAKGEIFLSPRLKAKKSVPFIDYSSWVNEWNNEFRVKPGT